MIELKDVKLIKAFQINEYEYCNYIVYFTENKDTYEVWLQNKNYGVIMLLYGVDKKQQSLEDFLNNYCFDEYIQEYQRLYENGGVDNG